MTWQCHNVIKNGEQHDPDKTLLFDASEFLAAPCQVTCKRVQISTFCDPWLWMGEFIANGWNSVVEG